MNNSENAIYQKFRNNSYGSSAAYEYARAIVKGRESGFEVRWEDEYELWDGDAPAPDYLFCGVVYNSKNEVITSLGMVGVESTDSIYLLDCEAHLMREALAIQDDENEKAAREYERSVVTYAGVID